MTNKTGGIISDDDSHVIINSDTFNMIRGIILTILKDKGEVSINELIVEADIRLKGNFNGSIFGNVMCVKHEMEKINEIYCDRSGKHQLIRVGRE